MAEEAKVSIITTTYNDCDNLKRIMEQILKQDYKNIEYIVVDGGSVDDTCKTLKEYEPRFNGNMKWISEKDTGIYSAINKGLKIATGDIIGCCFDEYNGNDVISKMVSIIQKEGTDGVHGDILYMDGERVVRVWKQGQGNIRTGWLPGHPTLYLKRKVYEEFGNYKEDYRIAADYEFMIRILFGGKIKLSYIPEVLIKMSYGGTSTGNLSSYVQSFKEGHRALRENKVSFAWFTDICRTGKVLMQFITKS